MRDIRYDRPMLKRTFRQVELMDRVMERLGADPAVAARLGNGMAWYEARTSCIACGCDRECRSWLERCDPFSEPLRSCPNAEFFRRCRLTSGNGRSPSTPARIDGGIP